MDIRTKYNVGDHVFTIDTNTLKVKKLEVGRITTWSDGNKTNVTLYPKGESYTSNGYDENKCFVTEDELVSFVTSTDEPAR